MSVVQSINYIPVLATWSFRDIIVELIPSCSHKPIHRLEFELGGESRAGILPAMSLG